MPRTLTVFPQRPARGQAAPRRAAAAKTAQIAPLALAALWSCGDLPVRHELEPAGVMKGTLTYSGPLPCTQNGHVLGSAEILVFDENLLPPPEGFGTTARSLATIAGDELFSAVLGSLPASSSGAIACPPAGDASAVVSASWSVGPLPAGRYQVRAFYDYSGQFSPLLKTHNLPTAGDVGGGAISNIADVTAKGAAPVYEIVTFGAPDADGNYQMPPNGAIVEGISVTVGLTLPFGRPIVHLSQVNDTRSTVTAHLTDPLKVTVPMDMRFGQSPTAHPEAADAEFIGLVLKGGVPPEEQAQGSSPPLSLQVVPPYGKLYVYPRLLAGGKAAAIPEQSDPPLADLFPQAIFSRLDPGDPLDLSPIADPAVILLGITTPDTLINIATPSWDGVTRKAAADQITVMLRPSVLCVRPGDPRAKLTLVTPSLKALNGEVVVGDVNDLATKLAARFGRRPSDVQVVEGCLPPGKYATNLIYDTGQAWTVPNEAGVCQAPLELGVPAGHPTACQQEGQLQRPLLASQSSFIRVGGEQVAGFCAGVAAQANPRADQYVAGIPAACLTAAEIAQGAANPNP